MAIMDIDHRVNYTLALQTPFSIAILRSFLDPSFITSSRTDCAVSFSGLPSLFDLYFSVSVSSVTVYGFIY